MWEEFRDNNLIFMWDVYCKRYGGDTMTAYAVYLRRWHEGKEKRIEVGHTIKSTSLGESWNAFGSHGFKSIEGFATRRYAIEYMLQARGFAKDRLDRD
jgi:hypothetical protein